MSAQMDAVTRPLTVKWNGKVVEGIEGVEGQEASVLKRAIEETCGLSVSRQKLLFKGRFLKDADVLDAKMFESGQCIMLLGTVGAADVSRHLASEGAQAAEQEPQHDMMDVPSGLKNLGNTCYVNSAVQVLSGLDQRFGLFEEARAKLDGLDPLAASFLSLLASLRKQDVAAWPLDFILKLRHKYAQYAEKNSHGVYIQHDVHEFWTTFMSYLGTTMRLPEDASIVLEKRDGATGNCAYERVNELLLPVTSETGHLEDSIKAAFTEKSTATPDCVSKTSFSNIPLFIPFVFMRFMWKTQEKVQAKILKLVTFPRSFDIMAYANEALREDINAKRATVPNFGVYQLEFIITHTGREADSGHYMAWRRGDASRDGEWFKFDDDQVSTIREEEVMKLGGGGDRPISYIIFYVPSWSLETSAKMQE